VGHRDQRHHDPGEAPDLGREHAARVDDELGLDRALVGDHPADATTLELDRRDAGLLADLGAAAPGSGGESEGELARVEVAVGGQVGGAEHAVDRHRREEPLSFRGRDQLQGQPEGLGPTGLARQLLHPLAAGGKPKRADLVPAGLQADLLAEGAIELDRAHHHPGQAQRAAQLADEAGRVEGRPAGQLRTLDQHGVGPAQPCEPVEDGAAAHAAADHDGAGLRPHCAQAEAALVAGRTSGVAAEPRWAMK